MKKLLPFECNQVNSQFPWKKPFTGGITAWRLDQWWFVALERLSRRSGLAILLIGLLSFIGSASVSMVRGYRLPRVHDEFSYLLAADTFASGRVTNPTHPMWKHFESFYVIHQPTYCSKYPPGQSLFLAVGQVLGGHPAVGVWISTSLMCAAICWMLYAWLPPPWALLGSFLATLQIGLAGYWAQTFWGGALAALGGALLYGSLRRIFKKPRFSHGLMMGLGLAVLANTRPFEGLLISLPAAGMFLYAFFGRAKPSIKEIFQKVAVPTTMILALTGTAMAYYNWRCTGEVLRMPYQVHEATYSIAPQITWQNASAPPLYRHRELKALQTNYIERHQEMKKAGLFSIRSKRRLIKIIQFYISPPLLIGLVTLPLFIWQRWQLLALLNCTGLVVFTMYTQGGWPHYPAPMTGLLYAMLAQGLRLCGLLRIGTKKHIGKYLVSMIVLACIAGAAIRITFDVRDTQGGFPTQRSEIIQTLVAKDGRHLVIVRYGSNHSVHQEWVYNRADIDGSRIAWARDMGCELNQELIEYFHDRHIWLLQVEDEASTPQLLPFETYVDQCDQEVH